MPDYPAPGSYAIDDPHRPGAVSFWTVDAAAGLTPWPLGAKNKYGPQRPPRTSDGGSAERRRLEMALWRSNLTEYQVKVIAEIAKDPAGATARFAASTDRCPQCRSHFHAEQVPGSAARGRGRAGC